MTILGKPRHFHTKWKFQVFVDGLGSAAFKTCSELKAEIGEVAYSEGGAIIPEKQPGRMTFSDITLERAATKDADLYNWFLITGNAALNGGLTSPKFKRSGTIVQHDRDNRVLRTWQISGMWPKSFVGGAWDNDADEFTMEQVVLCIDYFVLRKNVG